MTGRFALSFTLSVAAFAGACQQPPAEPPSPPSTPVVPTTPAAPGAPPAALPPTIPGQTPNGKIALNENFAIKRLRMIGDAEKTYIAQKGHPGSLAELIELKLIPDWLTNGSMGHGYKIGEVSVPTSGHRFEFKAEPALSMVGTRAFNLIEDNVIRSQPGMVAPVRDKGTPVAE
jgi:hypothetical protein